MSGDNVFAKIGKFESNVTLYVTYSIGICLIISAIFMFVNNNSSYVKTTGTVTSAKCTLSPGTKTVQYDCKLNIIYMVDGKSLSGSIDVNSPTQYTNGSTIEVSYDPKNPSIVSSDTANNIVIGIISICIAFVIIGIAHLNRYLTQSSSTYATIQGISDVSRML